MKNVYSIYRQLSINSYSGSPKENTTSWGTVVSSNKLNYKISDFNKEKVRSMGKFLTKELDKTIVKDDIHSKAILQLEKKRNLLKNMDITMEYNLTVDNSNRYLCDSKKCLLYEEKNIVIVELGYYCRERLIYVDSITLNRWNYIYLSQYLADIQNFIFYIINMEETCEFPDIKYIHLGKIPSAIITHEVFGHLFEQDNYNKIIAQNNIKIPQFINVYDVPNINTSGFSLFDDEGNKSKPLTIIRKGIVCNKVSSNYQTMKQNYIKNSRSRLGYGGNRLLPRITNTILYSEKEMRLAGCSNVLYIDTINTAQLHDGLLIFRVDFGRVVIGGKIKRVSNINIQVLAVDFIENIVGTYGSNKLVSSLSCIKYGQSRIGVGFSAPEIIVYINECKTINLSKIKEEKKDE